jgi:hypothetical protein
MFFNEGYFLFIFFDGHEEYVKVGTADYEKKEGTWMT